MPAKLSLTSRALQLLAQRDQSRVELRRKLVRHLARAARDGGAPGSDDEEGHAAVDAVLDWLEANRYLSAERFVESRIHARQARFGNLRIRNELAQHGVAPSADETLSLAASELKRAATVRERRFAAAPRDARERAAQARFLAARGFSPDTVSRLMRELREQARAPAAPAANHADEPDGTT